MTPLELARQLIVDASLAVGSRVYDETDVPELPALPYVTILDFVTDVPALKGDAATIARTRAMQASLWQERSAQDDDLLDAIVAALDGAAARDAGGYRFRVPSVVLVPEDKKIGIVHHALDVALERRP